MTGYVPTHINTYKWNSCFPKYMQHTLFPVLFHSLKCCLWPTNLFSWPTNRPAWPAVWKFCSRGGVLDNFSGAFITVEARCLPLDAEPRRLSVPWASPLAGLRATGLGRQWRRSPCAGCLGTWTASLLRAFILPWTLCFSWQLRLRGKV